MIFISYAQIQTLSFPYAESVKKFASEFRWDGQIPEEIEIIGRDLMARPSLSMTKDLRESYFETHQQYIDIQYIVDGVEVMQMAPEEVLKEVIPYDFVKDIRFFNANQWISDMIVPAGYVAVFFPQEAHRPSGCYQGLPSEVKKIVFKLKKDAWL